MAIRLAAEFDNMIAPLEKVVQEFEVFDPQQYQGQIAIVTDPYLMDEQGQRLLTGCHRAFPKAHFAFPVGTVTRTMKCSKVSTITAFLTKRPNCRKTFTCARYSLKTSDFGA